MILASNLSYNLVILPPSTTFPSWWQIYHPPPCLVADLPRIDLRRIFESFLVLPACNWLQARPPTAERTRAWLYAGAWLYLGLICGNRGAGRDPDGPPQLVVCTCMKWPPEGSVNGPYNKLESQGGVPSLCNKLGFPY